MGKYGGEGASSSKAAALILIYVDGGEGGSGTVLRTRLGYVCSYVPNMLHARYSIARTHIRTESPLFLSQAWSSNSVHILTFFNSKAMILPSYCNRY